MDNKELSLQIEELANSIKALSEKQNSQYTDIMLQLKEMQSNLGRNSSVDEGYPDEIYPEVIKMIMRVKSISTSTLQRKFSIGYSRAHAIMDRLKSDGLIVKKADGPYYSYSVVAKEETK